MDGYLPGLFSKFMDRDGVDVYNLAIKNEANIPQPSLPNKLGQ